VMVPEAPALPQTRAREVIGRRSPSSSGVVVSVLLLFFSGEEEYERGLLFPQRGGEVASRGDQEAVTHDINANPHSP
jgi:hypothetical protein